MEHSKDLRLSPNSNFFIEENPISEEVYMVLEEMDIETAGEVAKYLNTVSPNLSVCPVCSVDGFTHVEGCRLNERWNPKD